jgi:protocatechuate 3,4-dioxygenase beta subunit
MQSRRRIVVTLALALLAAIALWWWLGRTTDDAIQATDRDDAAKLASKRRIGAESETKTALPRARWQERDASVAGIVREKGGGPIANADVCAWIGDDTAPSSMKREPICTTSGADGRYVIADLPPLRMLISASAAEHIPGSYEAQATDARFQLQLGQAKVGVDIELVKGGVAVRGVVKDVSGGVIEGAFVSNEWYGWDDGPTRGRARTKTDEKGEFQLWLGKGGAALTASAEGYAPSSKNGPVPGFTFEILLTPESVLAGVVVRAGTGTPVANVRVSASGEWSWDGSGGEAYTDEDGRFRIDRLGPGRYKPAASASDGYGRAAQSVHLGLGESSEDLRIELHPAVSIRGRVVAAGESPTPCESGNVGLQDKIAKRNFWAETNTDGTVEFLAVLPGTYEVNVWCKGKLPREQYAAVVVATEPIADLVWEVDEGLALTGIVVAPHGEPIERARVSVQAKSATPRGQVGGAWGEPTDADGRFRATGLVAGTYSVRVNVGEQPFVPPIEPPEVEVAAGKTAEIRIVVEPAGSVEGRVLDTNNRPVADAEVSLRGDEAQWGASGSTRDDGTFTIESVRPQAYRATASIGWSNTMRAPGTKDDDVQGERVTVTAGETAKVELVVEDQSGTIVGRVVDEAGGPIDDAFVHANRESDSARKSAGSNRGNARWGGWDRKPVLTDQDGRFELTGLSPGNHTVFATRKGGGEGLTEHVEVGAREAVVRIAPRASISGTVTLSSGGAPTRFQVDVEDRSIGFEQSEEFYQTNGQWTLDELPPGNYEITVDATEGRDTDTTKLGEGEHKSGITLELTPKVDVEGTVVDLETGEPVPNIAVSISPRRGGMSFFFGGDSGAKENVSGADGKFTVLAAPTGKVRVMLMPRTWGDETYGWNTLGATIPADAQRHTLPPLRIAKSRTTRSKRPGDLGFTLKESPPELDIEDFPVTVAFIRPGGPAATTELAIGDVVTAVDGHDVTGENRHRWFTLTRVPQGTKITLDLENGKSVDIVTAKPP